MAAPTEDTLTKISTDAATSFIQSFYTALKSDRTSIAAFYSPVTSTILFNGNVVSDGSAVQDIFVNQMPPTHYEVQSVDCQIINASFPTPTAAGVKPASQRSVKDMSLLVIVSGYVRFGESQDLPQRGFSETFTLTPNPAADQGPKAKGKRDWAIQSQNFRLVV
ncbi:hypothetical protein Plec18167_006967 [Paecilomyces lecythidis]|uniref:NTF2 domain-containing protein n=1 Tax=Paecilomyces lecythidis TaxID=3004212 RepID=A0ABR3X7A8_9EURO